MESRYPNEFRVKVLKEVHAEDMSISAISKSYDICRETIYKWMKAEQEGTLFEDYRKNLGQKTSIDHDQVIQYVHKYPDAFQYEIAEMCNISQSAVCKILQAAGLKRKKKRKHTKK